MTPEQRWSAVADFWPLASASQFIRVHDIDFHVQIAGAGPDILLLHGAGASSHSFAGMAHRLAEHYRVICPDLPGQGFTTLLAPEAVGLGRFATYLRALLEAVNASPDWIIGHSAGSALAAQLALELAHRPRGLMCINAAFKPFGAMAAPFFSGAARWLSRSRWLPQALASPTLRWRATASMLSDTGSTVTPLSSRCYDTLLADPDHIAGTLRMMAGWDLPPLLDRLPELEATVWLVGCEGDRTIPPSRSLAVAPALPNCHTLRVPGLGHLGHEEHPETFVDIFHNMVSKHAIAG
ncbi:MAG: alpha/beta fold hydrolase BchO [Halieaceae bacterium]